MKANYIRNKVTVRICYAKGGIMDWWMVSLACTDRANATHKAFMNKKLNQNTDLLTPPWCDRGCNHNVSLPRVFAGNPGVGRNSGLRDSPLATKQSRQDSRASTTHTDLKKKDTEQRNSDIIL